MKVFLLMFLAFFTLNSTYAQVKATSAELNVGTDDDKFATALALQGSKYLDQSGAKLFAVTAVGANTYTATISPAITAYSTGQMFYIKITTANTAAATLSLNGLGAKSLVKDGAIPLVAGDLLANKIYAIYYDGTNLQVMNAADALKANLASPAFTGIPTTPTAAPGINTTQIATTAFVTSAVSQSQPAISVASNKLLGRYAATAGSPQDVTLGAGLTINSAGKLYVGYETGFTGTKLIKVNNPAGGQYRTADTKTGAIKIQLPTNSQVMYAIKGTIYTYNQKNSSTFLITCYASAIANGYSATFSSNNATNYPVRWYTNGATPAIYIGELNSTWSYLNVSIDEVQASHSAATIDNASVGWVISVDTAFTGTQSAIQLNTLPFSNLTQPLTGYAIGTNAAIATTDNIIGAFGKLQGQLNARLSVGSTQPEGTVLAGPVASTGAVAFRALVRTDTKKIFGADALSGVLDWNDITNTQPGFGPTLLYGTALNGTGVAGYYHPFTIEYGATKIGTGNLTQLGYPYSPSTIEGIILRTRYNGTWSAWRKVWDNVNFTNLNQLTTRNFADLQNRPATLSGYGITDAATQASVTANDAAAVHKTGNETITGIKLFSTNVGIGTTNTQGYKLAVGGSMIAESVKVKLQTAWPDYVFEKDYPMLSLTELEQFVLKNKHLPAMPTREEVKKEGIELGEISAKLLQKIEELTLYIIDLKKENEVLKNDIKLLKNK